MKKIFLILLLCAYALATVGVGFREFYCCGKLKSVTIAQAHNDAHQCTKEGCCKTKYQFLKLSDNHFASTDIFVPAKFGIALYVYVSAYMPVSFAQQTTLVHNSHAPPLYDDLPLYLSNCVFRI